MKTKQLAVLALLCGIFISCKRDETIKLLDEDRTRTEKKYDQIKELEWLVGKWENKTAQGSITENWVKLNDSTFSGENYILKGRDTIHQESVLLDQIGDSLHYVSTVRIVGGGKAVPFTLTSFTANKYVFENKKNDFPKKITYNKVAEDSIITEVSGMKNGKMSIEEYKLIRKK